ncbi:MAG: hypothetical protein PHV37_01000 [Candidatus Gastranaerophilales bacterium]|nr:hypothetical protein [Candidatus Gastranaerophilales bacterium]
MINEKQFAKYHTSLWKAILPLSNNAVKNINCIYSKTFTPIVISEYAPERRSLINHCAFNISKCAQKNKISIKDLKKNISTYTKAIDLTQNQLKLFVKRDRTSIETPSNIELEEIFSLSENIEKMLIIKHRNDTKIFNPKFKGCGILDDCYGDILIKNVLYEIKSTISSTQKCPNKNLRAIDLRQLLIYCALNYKSKQYTIKQVAYYNPKIGQYFLMDVQDLCLLVSGKNDIELFEEIINYVSDYDKSK